MSWQEAFQIVGAAIVSIAGSGTIFWLLSNHLGRLWADRYLEKIKNEYQKELESYKMELDIIKANVLRYSDKQFDLYNNLWEALCELEFAAEKLWSKANKERLINFSDKLEEATKQIKKSYLFIEEEIYQKLSKLLEEFCDYRIGKQKLVEIKKERNIRGRIPYSIKITDDEIRRLIIQNQMKKQAYIDLKEQLGKNLKKQLKGQ